MEQRDVLKARSEQAEFKFDSLKADIYNLLAVGIVTIPVGICRYCLRPEHPSGTMCAKHPDLLPVQQMEAYAFCGDPEDTKEGNPDEGQQDKEPAK